MAKKTNESTAQKAAKKQSAAKKPTKSKGKKAASKNGQLLEAARKILPRLKAGETSLGAERDKLRLSSNGPLRKALTELLGGKAAYRKMMTEAKEQGSKKAA